MAAVLLYLGQWQLDRLGWKQSILKDIESKISGTPQSLPDSINEIEHKYLPVVVSGKLDDNFIKIMVMAHFLILLSLLVLKHFVKNVT